jgi:glycosyltransferase involved in cell wall biosynthesis
MHNSINVWFINPYSNLPSDGWRLTRSSLLVQTLAEAGFTVTWYTTLFDHIRKEFRTPSSQTIEECGVTYHFVETCGYRENISLARLLSEAIFAIRLTRIGWSATSRPNIIVASHATLLSGVTAAILAKRHRVPLILDIADLWPEFFQLAFPSKLRKLARIFMSPLYWLRSLIFRQADAVTASARINLMVAEKIAKNAPRDKCLLIYEGIDIEMALQEGSPTDIQLTSFQINPITVTAVRIVYAGSLGSGYDIQTIIGAAAILEQRKARAQIVIAGDGSWRSYVEDSVRSIPGDYILYVGRITPPELHRLYQESHVGLCAYVRDSTVAIPCKFYDYLAEGLAIVSSLRGELADLIAEKQLGCQYEAGSAESLADTICRIAGDRTLLDRYRQNAKLAAAQFDRKIQYGKLVGLVRDILAETKKSTDNPQ